MFKRIAVLSLLLLYLCTTVGFAMSLHFCGTKISNIRINQSAKKPCCSNENEAKPDKCCKDKHLKIKVSDQQQTIQSAKVPAASNVDLFLLPAEDTFPLDRTASRHFSRSVFRGPPPTSGISLNLRYCNFRI
ncbi:HYC_CC_PP family protein [Daejeonella lutea]|uniref:Uncharacterized protein n=1 Tax=Daejeonella lutea TaxID=572036 RepID=A0A1T5DTD9_9SPHI|nr:hypothetical protein SAMN05661099_2590 [Daejeonella lutea]